MKNKRIDHISKITVFQNVTQNAGKTGRVPEFEFDKF